MEMGQFGIIEEGGPVADAKNGSNGTELGIAVIPDHEFDLSVL